LNPNGGWTVECGGNGAGRAGAGGTGALLDFTASPGTGLQIMSSVALPSATGGRFINCGIIGSSPSGFTLQLGRTDFADALNAFYFESIYIDNLGNATGGGGLQ